MSDALFGTYFLSALTLVVLASIGMLHFLLFREYLKQEKLQLQHLKDLERLVNLELTRSRTMNSQNQRLDKIKTKTEEQLEVIKLQIGSMKTREDTAGQASK